MATMADIQSATNTVVSEVTNLSTVVEQQAIPLLNQLASGGTVDPAQAQAVVDALTAASSTAKTTAADLSATVQADTPQP